MALEITKDNFEKEILSQGKAIIDFWAPWCGPCQMLTPIIEELAEEMKGKIKVGKVNVDEQNELAAQFGVMSIPTIVAFEDGKVIKKSIGVQPKENIIKMFNEKGN